MVVPAVDPPPAEGELIAFCAERLADYKVPTAVDFVDALPRNGMNRVMKGADRPGRSDQRAAAVRDAGGSRHDDPSGDARRRVVAPEHDTRR